MPAQEFLSADQAAATALGNHPLLAEGKQRIDSAQGQRRQAGLTFNPRLILQSENNRFPGSTPMVYGRDTDTFAYLQQTFETAGKRGKRVELASQGLRRAELELDLLRRQITSRVKLSYWLAAGAQRAHELLIENSKTFQQIVEYHEIRVREGAMAESDLLRVRLEADRIQLAANSAKLEADKARILLFREMGQTAFPSVQFSDALELKEDALVDALLEEALRRRPEIQLARVQLEQARANLRL